MCSQAEGILTPTTGEETGKGEGRQMEECLSDVRRLFVMVVLCQGTISFIPSDFVSMPGNHQYMLESARKFRVQSNEL